MRRAPLIVPLVVVITFAASCSRTPPQPAEKPRYGAVMSEVGRRFELAGRAIGAKRFELAAFEVGELEELFEGDLPRAELPKEGTPASLPALADAFLKTNAPELKKAAASKDPVAFEDAFQRAAAMCNGCHQASGHGFIEVPTALGKSVPIVD